MRAWLLTWTTYGTWLPGDERGFVSRRAVAQGRSEIHNRPATPYDARIPLLRDYSASLMRGSAIRLDPRASRCRCGSASRDGGHRGWRIRAGAIMANDVHLVVFALDKVASETLLRDLKAYASGRCRPDMANPSRTHGGPPRALAVIWSQRSRSTRPSITCFTRNTRWSSGRGKERRT